MALGANGRESPAFSLGSFGNHPDDALEGLLGLSGAAAATGSAGFGGNSAFQRRPSANPRNSLQLPAPTNLGADRLGGDPNSTGSPFSGDPPLGSPTSNGGSRAPSVAGSTAGSTAASLTLDDMIWPNGEVSHVMPDSNMEDTGVPHFGWQFQQQWISRVGGRVKRLFQCMGVVDSVVKELKQ